jgi:hypothetical protein
MNPARSNKWKFMVTAPRLRGGLNLAFLHPHYNHPLPCRSAPRRLWQRQILTRYT